MIINIIEEIEAKSTDTLLSHDCFIEDPGEDVADDGAGVVHRPLDRHQLVHLLLAHLGPVPPADGRPADEAHLPLHLDGVLGDGGEGRDFLDIIWFYVTIYLVQLRGWDRTTQDGWLAIPVRFGLDGGY